MSLKEEAANTNWVALVLLVLIVGALAFGIYWWKKQSATKITPVATPIVSPTTTPTETDETAGWKTYEDTTVGFLIKYPENWIYKDDYKTENLFVAFGSDKKDLPSPNTDASAGISIRVQEKIKDSDRTTDTSKMKKEEITINGIKATKVTLSPGRKDDFMGESKIVSVEIPLDDGKVLVLENVDDYGESVFNKMLSTFEFAE